MDSDENADRNEGVPYVSSNTTEPPSGEGEIVLVGTAHVSKKSVQDVENAIEQEDPDVVAVELDEKRYESIKGDRPDDLEPKELIQGNKPFEFLVYWFLSYLQAKMGEEFGIEPGADMIAAIEEAEDRDIPVALVDRDIHVTVQRMWAKMTLWEKLKMVGGLFVGMLGFGRMEEIDVDELAEGDLVETMIDEFREISPRAAEALIDERDAYIASNLIRLRDQGYEVVAVVGAGHERGISGYLENPETLPSVENFGSESSRRFSVFKAGGYLISIFIVFMFVLLFMAGVDNAVLMRLFAYWFLVNGVLAFLGAMIAGGHLTSALTGGLVAWMTSINPALAPGWFAGYVELRYVDISVTDIDEINEIITDTEDTLKNLVRRMYAVPMFRLLLVVALTNMGSIIGTALFVSVVLPYVGQDVNMTQMLSEGLANSWQSIVGTARALLGF